jgi:DNA-binding NtrC family response regulator
MNRGTKLNEAVEQLERRMIRDALRLSEGNIARAARELGLSRKGLYLKMERLNFLSESVRSPQSSQTVVSEDLAPPDESMLS